MDLLELLKKGFELKASDIHLATNQHPIMRIDGKLKIVDENIINDDHMNDFVNKFVPQKCISWIDERGDCDFSFSLDFSRFRVSVFRTMTGLSAAIRYIPSLIRSLDDLQAPSILKSLCRHTRGLILVTGATGSGKSTTLAAMIDHINNDQYCHVITIEDPIEFIHKSKKSLINQREVYQNCSSFSQALKASLREDPDVILIGELRDLESIRLALTAAETGHLVFGTLHTSSAVKTIDRIVDVFPEHEKNIVRMMLSESIISVISQTLIPKATGKGRVAAHEIMISNHAVKNLIRENKLSQITSVMQTGQTQGMQTLDQCLRNLIKSGMISKEDALKYAQDKNSF